MTPEQTAALNELFQLYGRPSNEADIRITGYLLTPESIDTPSRVSSYDHTAEALISEFQKKIDQLKIYRIALAQRYSELETAPKIPVVRLRRVKTASWAKEKGRVFYYLTTHERYLNDGHEVKLSSIEYSGSKRSEAIAAFHSYVKSHPGITAEIDIGKSRWER